MASIEDRISAVLSRMMERIGKLDGVMIVDTEGFVITTVGSSLNRDESEMVGGIITSLAGMTTKVAEQLNAGLVDRVMIHGDKRHIFLSRISSSFNMVTIARFDATLGLVFSEIKKAGAEIAQIMEGGPDAF